VTVVADACHELAQLTPHLAPPLTHDNARQPLVTRWETSLSLVNTDVLSAIITLRYQIPAVTMRAAQLVNEPWQPRTHHACLIALPRLDERIEHIGLIADHKHLIRITKGWVRLTKQALGLATRPRQLSAPCPYCDTGTLTMDIGTEGFMDPKDLTAPPTWVEHGAHVYCPDCEADWPQSQWELLIRILEQATGTQVGTAGHVDIA